MGAVSSSSTEQTRRAARSPRFQTRLGVEASHERYKWWALSCTSLGMLLAATNSGTLIIALPDLERELLDPRPRMLAVTIEAYGLIASVELLAIEHFQVRLGSAPCGANLEQRFLAGAKLALGRRQALAGNFPPGLEPLDLPCKIGLRFA